LNLKEIKKSAIQKQTSVKPLFFRALWAHLGGFGTERQGDSLSAGGDVEISDLDVNLREWFFPVKSGSTLARGHGAHGNSFKRQNERPAGGRRVALQMESGAQVRVRWSVERDQKSQSQRSLSSPTFSLSLSLFRPQSSAKITRES